MPGTYTKQIDLLKRSPNSYSIANLSKKSGTSRDLYGFFYSGKYIDRNGFHLIDAGFQSAELITFHCAAGFLSHGFNSLVMPTMVNAVDKLTFRGMKSLAEVFEAPVINSIIKSTLYGDTGLIFTLYSKQLNELVLIATHKMGKHRFFADQRPVREFTDEKVERLFFSPAPSFLQSAIGFSEDFDLSADARESLKLYSEPASAGGLSLQLHKYDSYI